MRSSSFRFEMARRTNVGLLVMLLFNSSPEAALLLVGDKDTDDVSMDGDVLPPDILDRIDCESSDTVLGLCMESMV